MRNDDFLIIANGERLSSLYLKKYSLNKIIIALDGAANHLTNSIITPNIILGDLDSITISTRKYFENLKTKFIYTPDQNFTDLEKAILYADQQQANSITIINALGKRSDHMLGNISFLKKYYQTNRRLIIANSSDIIEFVKDQSLKFIDCQKNNIAIIGYSSCIASSNGLKYELSNNKLNLGVSESLCNQIIASTTIINIQGEAIIIYAKKSLDKIIYGSI
jgi:thiamine pyrophosphokinase